MIGPDYFSIKGNKEHKKDPLAYALKTMGMDVKKISPAELNQRAASMVLHREKCIQMANNDRVARGNDGQIKEDDGSTKISSQRLSANYN